MSICKKCEEIITPGYENYHTCFLFKVWSEDEEEKWNEEIWAADSEEAAEKYVSKMDEVYECLFNTGVLVFVKDEKDCIKKIIVTAEHSINYYTEEIKEVE